MKFIKKLSIILKSSKLFLTYILHFLQDKIQACAPTLLYMDKFYSLSIEMHDFYNRHTNQQYDLIEQEQIYIH